MRASRRLAALALLTTGCSFTTMTPAHRLRAGELVLQGAIDEPGFVYLPRLSGQLTYGTGGLDLGAHLGTSALLVNAGATARLYLGGWALAMQTDAMLATFQDSFFSSGRLGVLTVTPRFGRLLANDKQHWYGGLQSPLIIPFEIDENGDLPSSAGVAFGFYAGYAWDSPSNVDLQVELSASPIGVFPGVYSEGVGYGVGLAPIAQLGFAVQYRRERDRRAPAPPTPQPQPRPHHGPAPIL